MAKQEMQPRGKVPLKGKHPVALGCKSETLKQLMEKLLPLKQGHFPFPFPVNDSTPALLFKLPPLKSLQPGCLLQLQRLLILRDGRPARCLSSAQRAEHKLQIWPVSNLLRQPPEGTTCEKWRAGIATALTSNTGQWVSRGMFNTPAHFT